MSSKILVIVLLGLMLIIGITVVNIANIANENPKNATIEVHSNITLPSIEREAIKKGSPLTPDDFPNGTQELVTIAREKIEDSLLGNPAYNYEITPLIGDQIVAQGQVNQTDETLELPEGKYILYIEHNASGTIIKLDNNRYGYLLQAGEERIIPVPQKLKTHKQDIAIKRMEMMVASQKQPQRPFEFLITFEESAKISQKYLLEEETEVSILGRTLKNTPRYLLLVPSINTDLNRLDAKLESYPFVKYADANVALEPF